MKIYVLVRSYGGHTENDMPVVYESYAIAAFLTREAAEESASAEDQIHEVELVGDSPKFRSLAQALNYRGEKA